MNPLHYLQREWRDNRRVDLLPSITSFVGDRVDDLLAGVYCGLLWPVSPQTSLDVWRIHWMSRQMVRSGRLYASTANGQCVMRMIDTLNERDHHKRGA